jgi:hypothetical protein
MPRSARLALSLALLASSAAQAGIFADVPFDSPGGRAYQLLLGADLLPDPHGPFFCGPFELTRFEMADAACRAVTALEALPRRAPGGAPLPAAGVVCDAVNRLCDEFGTELRRLRQDPASLRRRVEAVRPVLASLPAYWSTGRVVLPDGRPYRDATCSEDGPQGYVGQWPDGAWRIGHLKPGTHVITIGGRDGQPLAVYAVEIAPCQAPPAILPPPATHARPIPPPAPSADCATTPAPVAAG